MGNKTGPMGLVLAIALGACALLAIDYMLPGKLIRAGSPAGEITALSQPEDVCDAKCLRDRIAKARERSARVKGVYMTSGVATDNGRAATKLRDDIVTLLDTTELNGVVIDVKETDGGLIVNDNLRALIRTLHEKGAWVIARMATFKDSSQALAHPEWYLKRSTGLFWKDNRSGLWLDPASRDVWAYELVSAEAANDTGFDEIQFDYVRFPSDGDMTAIVWPFYDEKTPKYEILSEFFAYLHTELKHYRPDLIVSADLFGYVALQHSDLGIGQRLQDIGENFDYVSLMVYPSHYYAGFQVAADPLRNLPALYYPYQSKNVAEVAPNHPFDVVYRSLLSAGDELNAWFTASSTPNEASTTEHTSSPGKEAKLRPWLQDFDLAVDSNRGIYYDAAKVRAQIDAAEQSGASGWLLWSPTNIYTKAALKSE